MDNAKRMSFDSRTLGKILDALEADYPDAGCALEFSDPYELLIATVLSAQCTDVRVNIVTQALFHAANTPQKILDLGVDRLIGYIKSCGLSRTKSKNIIALSEKLIAEHGGTVPGNFDELTQLPGVGRKTANVVLANAFGEQTIAVDTHVFRVSNRIGLARADNVLNTEKQLTELIPYTRRSLTHHLLIHHGRQICSARKPACGLCSIRDYCLYENKTEAAHKSPPVHEH